MRKEVEKIIKAVKTCRDECIGTDLGTCKKKAAELYDFVCARKGNQLGELSAIKFVQLLAACCVLPGDCGHFARPIGVGCVAFLNKHYPKLTSDAAFRRFKLDLQEARVVSRNVADSQIEVICCEAHRREKGTFVADLFHFDKDRSYHANNLFTVLRRRHHLKPKSKEGVICVLDFYGGKGPLKIKWF